MSLETKTIVAAAKRRPALFICGGLVLALGLLTYFRLDVPEEIETRLAEREKELTRLSNNVRFSAQLDAHLQALQQANATIEAGALRVDDRARNQQVFFLIEADTGVKVMDLRQLASPAPAKGAPATTYAPIPFSLTVRGDYSQLIDFLVRLDRGATLSRVTSATSAQPTEGAQMISLTVQLLGFRP